MKVVFVTPTRARPHKNFIKALEESVPVLDKAGIEHSVIFEIGNHYISHALSLLVSKALASSPDAVVILEDDMSWEPQSLVDLINCDKDVVAGVYRYKDEKVDYMGVIETTADGKPVVVDGLIRAMCLPTGFMKITPAAVKKFAEAYPNLVYGEGIVDLFNHGAHEGKWWGQDYAFCRNYRNKCGDVWLMPNLDIHHNSGDDVHKGNFHEYLLRQPGGSKAANLISQKAA